MTQIVAGAKSFAIGVGWVRLLGGVAFDQDAENPMHPYSALAGLVPNLTRFVPENLPAVLLANPAAFCVD